MAYHEALWATVGAAAPVLALAHAVTILPVWREHSAVMNLTISELSRRIAEVPSPYPQPATQEQRNEDDRNERILREKVLPEIDRTVDVVIGDTKLRRAVLGASILGLALGWLAFAAALCALAVQRDWLWVSVPVILLVCSSLLLAFTPTVLMRVKFIAPSS